MKPKIILLGAFDRYNYGDNLLPILFEMYLEQCVPGLLSRYELVHCSITASDLSRYGTRPTVAMREALPGENVHSIIAIGGEVLAASSSVLVLHNSPSRVTAAGIRFLQSHGMKALADLACRKRMGLPWEFPYVPRRSHAATRIAFNAVGGRLPESLAERLRSADYVSVRDRRTMATVERVSTARLCPDSAVTLGALVSDDFLSRHIAARVKSQLGRRYLCFQAAPAKIGSEVNECIEVLRDITTASGLELLLLPIGYASGHDDKPFLSELHADPRLASTLLPDMTMWETLALIKHSQAFMGTSLHGCITAMAYGVPHIGLNPQVAKLQSFLQDWALPPLDRCFHISEAADAFAMATSLDRDGLLSHAAHLQALGMQNYEALLAAIGLPGVASA